MIINERFKKPVISFGLGQTSLICGAGEKVTIWQNEIYNSEQYSLIQNEILETITLTYSDSRTPKDELTAEFKKIGDYNSRAYYSNESDFTEKIFIFWDGSKWMIVFAFNPAEETFKLEVGRLNIDIPTPVYSSWITGKSGLIPIKTTSNINTQSFTFPAVESKSIQIQMKSKISGQLLQSNKIELIIK